MQSDIPGMASSRTCWPALSRRFRTRGWLRAGRRYGQHYSGNILTLRWQDRKSLRNIGSKFFLTLKSMGGGSCSPSPIIHIENGIKRFLYVHIAYPSFLLKIWPFSKISKPKSSFLNIFQKFLQKWTPNTLFTLFWYPTLYMWNFHFSSFWF